MKSHIASDLIKDIDTAFITSRKIMYQPVNAKAVEVTAVSDGKCILADGRFISLLDDETKRDSFWFSAEVPLTENEKRKKLLENPKTWLEAKEDRALFISSPALMPVDEMFDDKGYLYPTKCYTPERTQKTARYLPVRYNIDYVLDFYQQRVIKQLSLENQRILLKAITALYVEDTYPRQGDINEYLETLTDEDKLRLCKDIAKSLGKRVIANK